MSFFRSHCCSALRRALCLVCVLAVLLLAGCKTEIYQGLSENQANTMLSVLLRHGISAEKVAAKSDFMLRITVRIML